MTRGFRARLTAVFEERLQVFRRGGSPGKSSGVPQMSPAKGLNHDSGVPCKTSLQEETRRVRLPEYAQQHRISRAEPASLENVRLSSLLKSLLRAWLGV